MRRVLAGLGGSIFAMSLVGLGLGLPSPARAADDGYANVFSAVLGAVGLIKPDPPPEIDYRERAPLVVPPQATLPPPVASGAKRNAAWPQDPDIVRRRKESEEARAPRTQRQNDGVDLLSSADMAKGRAQSEAVNTDSGDCRARGNSRNCLLVSPDELKAEGDRFAASNPESTDTVKAGQEPDRVYLTQPPKGYMKATRTVKATAEPPVQRIDPGNPRSFLVKQNKDDE